jgi:hypothetical protein
MLNVTENRLAPGEQLAAVPDSVVADGYAVSICDVVRDVNRMFSGNFRGWVGLK